MAKKSRLIDLSAIHKEKISDDFVGRTAEDEYIKSRYQELSKRLKDNNTENDYFLINVYGMGGKGKSKFASHLMNNIHQFNPDQSKESPVEFVKTSFEKGGECKSSNIIDVLELFRAKLNEKEYFDFKPFDDLLKAYRYSRNEEIKIVEAEKDSVSMPRFVVSVLGRALLRVVVPLGDAAEELFYGIKDGLDERETAKENEKIKSVAKNFDEENPTILIRKLKETFEECYNAGIKKVEQPLLFFIDVFEDYNVSPEWLLTGKNTKAYGYGLFHSLDNTLWVISGRDQLPLYETDDWTEDNSAAIMLKNLNQSESEYFLEKNDIKDKKIVQAVWEQTEGFPLWMGIYRDFFLGNEWNKMDLSVLEDQSLQTEKQHTLIERYMKYLEDDENFLENQSFNKLIQLLVCLGSWTDQLFDNMESKAHPLIESFRFEEKLLNRLNKKSFISQKDLEDGTVLYSIDKTVAETLFCGENFHEPLIDASFKKAALKILIDMNKTGELREDEQLQIIKLTNFLYKGDSNHQRLNTLYENLVHVMNRYTEAGDYRSVALITFQMYDGLDPAYFSTSNGVAEFCRLLEKLSNHTIFDVGETLNHFIDTIDCTTVVKSALGDYFFQAGDIEKAIDYFEQVLAFTEEMKRQIPDGYLYLSDCHFTISKEHQMTFEIDIWPGGNKKSFYVTDHKEEFETIIKSIFGRVNCYILQNQYTTGTDLIDFLNVYIQQVDDYALERMVHLYYALLYCYGNGYKLIGKHLDWLKAEFNQNGNNQDVLYLKVLSTCCAQLAKHDHVDMAYGVYQTLEPLISDMLKEEGIYSSFMLYDIGVYFYHMKEFNLSDVLLEKAWHTQSRGLPETHPTFLHTSHYYAKGLVQMGEWKKAKDVLEETLSGSLRRFGEQHILTSEIYEALGDIESLRLNHKEAETFYKKSFWLKYHMFGSLAKLTVEVEFKWRNVQFQLAKQTNTLQESDDLRDEFDTLLNIMVNTDNHYEDLIPTVRDRLAELENKNTAEDGATVFQKLLTYAEHLNGFEEDFKVSGLMIFYRYGFKYGYLLPLRMKKLKELGHEPTPQEMRQIKQVCENTAEQNARVVVDAQKASFMWNQMVYYCNTESSLDVNSLIYIFKTGAFDGMLDAAKIVSALDPAIEMPNIKEEVYQMESSPQKFAEAFKAVAEYVSLIPNIFKEEG